MPTRAFASSLISLIERRFQLSAEERAAIEALPVHIVDIPAGHAMVREGDKPSRSNMIMEGVACTSKTLLEGERQITAFHITQDLPDLLSLHLEVMDTDVSAITGCRVGFVDHTDIRRLYHAYPRIGEALWRITLVEAAIFRQWVVNLGNRGAEQRLLHLLLEFMTKMEVVGLAPEGECDFPMTQTVLSEATGMSTVHLNRCLQSLRSQGLIRLHDKRLSFPNRDRAEEFAEFSAAYLHLPSEGRSRHAPTDRQMA